MLHSIFGIFCRLVSCRHCNIYNQLDKKIMDGEIRYFRDKAEKQGIFDLPTIDCTKRGMKVLDCLEVGKTRVYLLDVENIPEHLPSYIMRIY